MLETLQEIASNTNVH